MWFITFVTFVKTLLSSSLIFFDMRAALWGTQCVQRTSSVFFFTSAWRPALSPDNDRTPSVQSPMQLFHIMSFSSNNLSIILKVSLDMALQNNISSIISVSLTYRTYAIKRASAATSVASSTCMANFEVRIRETTWSQISSDISLILLQTVLSASGICCSCFAYGSPNIILTISVAAGNTKVSAIVCGFLHFAIL